MQERKISLIDDQGEQVYRKEMEYMAKTGEDVELDNPSPVKGEKKVRKVKSSNSDDGGNVEMGKSRLVSYLF